MLEPSVPQSQHDDPKTLFFGVPCLDSGGGESHVSQHMEMKRAFGEESTYSPLPLVWVHFRTSHDVSPVMLRPGVGRARGAIVRGRPASAGG